jgi:hypothetical protein
VPAAIWLFDAEYPLVIAKIGAGEVIDGITGI